MFFFSDSFELHYSWVGWRNLIAMMSCPSWSFWSWRRQQLVLVENAKAPKKIPSKPLINSSDLGPSLSRGSFISGAWSNRFWAVFFSLHLNRQPTKRWEIFLISFLIFFNLKLVAAAKHKLLSILYQKWLWWCTRLPLTSAWVVGRGGGRWILMLMQCYVINPLH